MLEEMKLWEKHSSLQEELKSMSKEEKEEAFHQEISFGTGGMRGILGPGTNRMNIYTVKRAVYAYAMFLKSKFIFPHVVIGYDNRFMSKEFAYLSAGVLGLEGIKVHMFEDIVPTPLVSFACKFLNTGGAIMFTASHNPPNYNGMKFYGPGGGQLDNAGAKEVIDYLQEAPHYFAIQALSLKELLQLGLIEMIGTPIINAYFAKLTTLSVFPDLPKEDFAVTFSALHGTTQKFFLRFAKEQGYDVSFVLEQSFPDPNFATVELPNPEYNEAFKEAEALGKKKDSKLLFASDPDGDRLGVSVQKPNKEYQLLTGNQLGLIYIDYIIKTKDLHDGVIINTIVSSALANDILEKNGIKQYQTLTGFKYIIDQVLQLEKQEKFLLGYEESNGYLFDDFVQDKDAIQAAFVALEAASFYQTQNKSFLDVLDEIYDEYGFVAEETTNITISGVSGLAKQEEIMEYFRKTYSKHIREQEKVIFEDYLNQTITKQKKSRMLDFPKSNVVRFVFEDGSFIALRPSGTEPILKIYFSMKGETLEVANNKKTKYQEDILQRIAKLTEEEE